MRDKFISQKQEMETH